MEAISGTIDLGWDDDWTNRKDDVQSCRFAILSADDLTSSHIHRFALRYAFDNNGERSTAGQPDMPDHVKESQDASDKEGHAQDISHKRTPWRGQYKISGRIDRDGNTSVDAKVGGSKGNLNLDAAVKVDCHGKISAEISAEGNF